MRQALSVLLLSALLASYFPGAVRADDVLQETGSSTPEEIPKEIPESLSSENPFAPVEASSTEPVFSVDTEIEIATTSPEEEVPQDEEELNLSFTGIGQTEGNMPSNHLDSGKPYFGQVGIQFKAPAYVHYIVVYPDTHDSNFQNCKDSRSGTETLRIDFGEDIAPWEGRQLFFPTQQDVRTDGGCLYENIGGVFVYPEGSYNIGLNNGFGSSVGFEYLGTGDAVSENLGQAYLSSGNGLEWQSTSSAITSLRFLISTTSEPPPDFGIPEEAQYEAPTPDILASELERNEILSQGGTIPANPNSLVAYNATLNAAPTFKQEGVLKYIVMPLAYQNDNPTTSFYFYVSDGNRNETGCRTPEKKLYEWGIPNRGKPAREVIIGPFEGGCFLNEGNASGSNFVHLRVSDSGISQGLATAKASSSNYPVFTAYSETVAISNVLFLPGIKGSRLYIREDDTDRKLWEPNGADDVPELFLTADGKSLRSDIFVKRGAIVDDIAFNLMNIYDSFIQDMDGLVTSGVITDWEAVPYDWRLSLPDIVNTGSEHDGGIFYGEATSTPYLEQTLRELAATSKSGKVTLVAHSNGGLVAKELMHELGDTETAALIDKIIFVGVPQSGAPQALGALLFGQREQLPNQWWLPAFILPQETARAFAENSPMGYHLLPSQAYFDAVREDENHPVAQFLSGYEEERSAYDGVIGTFNELAQYLRAEDDGRVKPGFNDLHTPNVLRGNLIDYAQNIHADLDSWVPPAGIELYQIAGWGEDTISGVEFYEECGIFGCKEKYRPVFTEDGDGVVPVPSALETSDST